MAATPTWSPSFFAPIAKIFVGLLLSLGGMNTSNPNPTNPIQQFLYSIAKGLNDTFDPPPRAGTPTVGTPNLNTGTVTGTTGFPTGSGLTYTTTQPATGTVTVASDGTFTYTPNQAARQAAGLTTTDTFTATVHEGLSTNSVTVTVPIDPGTPVAGTPTAGSPNTNTGSVVGSGLFTDTAGRILTYSTSTTSTAGATVSLNSTTGAYTYTPTQAQRQTAGLSTTDTFTVTANNGVRSTAETVTVAVDPGTPVAGTATVGTPNSTTGVVTGSAVFTDTAGRTVTYSTSTTSTGGGTVSINTNTGAYTYTPGQAQRQAATSTTTDAFTVTASNGVRTATETVTVPVDPGNLVAGTPTVGSPNSFTGSVTGYAAFTDTAGRTLTYSDAGSSAGGGTVFVNPTTGFYTYIPTQMQRQAATATTTDTFTVTASNGVGSATQTVTVAVDPGTPLPAVPIVGMPNANSGAVNGTAQFDDTAGRTLTYSASTSSSSGGAVTIDSRGNFTFTPTIEQRLAATTTLTATDTLTITVTNGVRTSSETVTVPVSPAQITRTVPVAAGINQVVVSPDGGTLYVTNTSYHTLTIISTVTGRVTGSVAIGRPGSGGRIDGVAVSPDGRHVYAVNLSQRTVSVIDSLAGTVVTDIPLSNGPTVSLGSGTYTYLNPGSLAISPDASTVYVTGELLPQTSGYGLGYLSVISTASNSLTAASAIETTTAWVAASPDGGRIYITDKRAGTVLVATAADPTTITNTIAVGAAPVQIAVSPDSRYVYVSNQNDGTVSVINTATNNVTATVVVDANGPAKASYGATTTGSIAVSPDGKYVYVLNPHLGSVVAIDTVTDTVVGTVQRVGGTGLAVSPDGTCLYVTDSFNGTVSVISL